MEELSIPPSSVLDNPLPAFEPSIRVQFESMSSACASDDPLSLFISLFGEQSLEAIVVAKAADFVPETPSPTPRSWQLLTRNELIVFIGTLFYMGRHHEYNREYYWNEGMHAKLKDAMGKTRWEQILRFLSLNVNDDFKRPDFEQAWHYKVEPILSIIRTNIAASVKPSSWLAVDEMMGCFRWPQRQHH